MDRCAEAEEVDDIKEQIRLAMETMATSKGREQLRWIVPPGAEEQHRKEALARARRLVEGEREQCLEEEEDPEGERPIKWRGLRRGRGGQMRFIVGDGDVGDQECGEESQARDEQGRGPGQEADGRVEQEEDGGRESAAGDRVDERDSGGGTGEGRERDSSKRGKQEDEQEPPVRQQREEDEDGRPKSERARRVRYRTGRIGRMNMERCEKG